MSTFMAYPFHPRREPGTATSSQARSLDFIDNLYQLSIDAPGNSIGPSTYPVVALKKNLLGLIPIAILLGTFQVRCLVAVQILEDPVLVLQAPKVCAFWRLGRILYRGQSSGLLCGSDGAGQSRCSAGRRWEDARGESGDGLGRWRVSREHRGGWLCSNEPKLES